MKSLTPPEYAMLEVGRWSGLADLSKDPSKANSYTNQFYAGLHEVISIGIEAYFEEMTQNSEE